MITTCSGKFVVLADFERAHRNDLSRIANRCNGMVHKMSAILADTITLFSVEI